MKDNRFCCCWDLEGPITILDFAAELGKKLQEKPTLDLQDYNMAEFFKMISLYDDYIVDVPGVKSHLKIPDYQPGDTLRIMAPLYTACYTDEELIELAKSNLGLLPGCRDLMKILKKDWEIFVISTSYTHFAYNVTAALGIPEDHVYCTELNIEELKKDLQNIEGDVDTLIKKIFPKYMDNNHDLTSVLDDLNKFFWRGKETDYIRIMNKVKVRGGKRKEEAVEEISARTGVPISDMIGLGDSITDINMLQRIKEENGIAISFNGNRFSLERANVAITTPNCLGVLPIFQKKENIHEFLTEWEKNYNVFRDNPSNIKNGLISEENRDLFIKYNFVPKIAYLPNKSEVEMGDIISEQEKMRKIVRGWAGNLG